MLTTLPSDIQLNHSSGVALPLLSITITVSQLSVLSGFTLHLSGHQAPLAESQDGLLQPMNPCFLPCLIFIYIMIEREEKEKKRKERERERPKIWLRIKAAVKGRSLGQWTRVAFLPTLLIKRQEVPALRLCKSFWNWLQLVLNWHPDFQIISVFFCRLWCQSEVTKLCSQTNILDSVFSWGADCLTKRWIQNNW